MYIYSNDYIIILEDVFPNGKALDVRPLIRRQSHDIYHSTNQEIHGSIPCTFSFFFSFSFFQFLWNETGESLSSGIGI